jgi:hypothetical protein
VDGNSPREGEGHSLAISRTNLRDGDDCWLGRGESGASIPGEVNHEHTGMPFIGWLEDVMNNATGPIDQSSLSPQVSSEHDLCADGIQLSPTVWGEVVVEVVSVDFPQVVVVVVNAKDRCKCRKLVMVDVIAHIVGGIDVSVQVEYAVFFCRKTRGAARL